MNKLLHLAEQAGFIISDNVIHFDEGDGTITSCVEAHKLADLVLQECLSVIEHEADTNTYGYAVRDGLDALKKHFGLNRPYAVFAIALKNFKLAATTRPYDLLNSIGLPGGKVEDDETAIEALIRECREEGWNVSIDEDAGRWSHAYIDGKLIEWYVVKNPIMLTDYKEKEAGIVPFWATHNEIIESGNGNECIKGIV